MYPFASSGFVRFFGSAIARERIFIWPLTLPAWRMGVNSLE
jgi:hypothetical protein